MFKIPQILLLPCNNGKTICNVIQNTLKYITYRRLNIIAEVYSTCNL